jgi:hypothetical protein
MAVEVEKLISQVRVVLFVRSGVPTVAPLTMPVPTARSLGVAMLVATQIMSNGLARR